MHINKIRQSYCNQNKRPPEALSPSAHGEESVMQGVTDVVKDGLHHTPHSFLHQITDRLHPSPHH